MNERMRPLDRTSAANFTPTKDEPDAPVYRGGKGWVIVAEGSVGPCIVLYVGPNFGAMRFEQDELAHATAEDLGFDAPGEQGVFRGELEYFSYRMHEGDYDSGFRLIGEWKELDLDLDLNLNAGGDQS